MKQIIVKQEEKLSYSPSMPIMLYVYLSVGFVCYEKSFF